MTKDIVAAPESLLDALRGLIRQGRRQVLRAVDMVQVQTCWEIARHIVEFEQGGESRAAYGKRLLPQLAANLTQEFGKGFDASNLRYMRLFYNELSWTHYRTLLRVSDPKARQWYADEAAAQNWSARALDRQIVLPTEEELRVEIEREREMIEAARELRESDA